MPGEELNFEENGRLLPAPAPCRICTTLVPFWELTTFSSLPEGVEGVLLIASFTSRGSIVLILLGSLRRRNGARSGVLLASDEDAALVLLLSDFEGNLAFSDLFKSVFGEDEILERIEAVDVNGSGLD